MELAEDRGTALARLASIVRLIAARPGISVGELSLHFGRPRRSIRRDIETLDRAGIGDYLPGSTFEIDYFEFLETGRLYLREPLNLDAPLRLTDSELVRLVTGLRAIAPTLDAEEQGVLPAALSALFAARDSTESSSGTHGLSEVATSAMSALTASKIGELQAAVRSGGTVTFNYVDGAGRASARTVSPDELVCGDDGWVVSGWCADAQASRTFRLDRMTNLVGAQKTIPAAPPPSSVRVAPAETEGPVGEEVRVTLRAEGRWRAMQSCAEVEAGEDGTLCLTYRVWERNWMRSELLSLAPFVITTDPVTYFEEAGDFARRALRIRQAEVEK